MAHTVSGDAVVDGAACMMYCGVHVQLQVRQFYVMWLGFCRLRIH